MRSGENFDIRHQRMRPAPDHTLVPMGGHAVALGGKRVDLVAESLLADAWPDQVAFYLVKQANCFVLRIAQIGCTLILLRRSISRRT